MVGIKESSPSPDTVKRIFTVTIDEFTACGKRIESDDIERALLRSSSFCDVDKIEVIEREERNTDSLLDTMDILRKIRRARLASMRDG